MTTPFFSLLLCRPWNRHYISCNKWWWWWWWWWWWAVFKILTLEVGTGKIFFRHYNIWIKTSRHIVAVIALATFHIVMHSYAASFLRKVILCKTNNIFCSQEDKNIKFGTKLIPY